MDIEKLKKLNSDPKELEAPASLVLTGLESRMKELLAEQMIMNSRFIVDKADLTKRLEESEKERSFQLTQVKALVVTLTKKLEEFQQLNNQKLEKASQIMNEESKKSHETNSKIRHEVMNQAHQVKAIPNPNCKERTKQYATELLITVGLATVLLGVFRLVILLMTLLKHLSLIHISEPTRLGMISYAVFCLKKKKKKKKKKKSTLTRADKKKKFKQK